MDNKQEAIAAKIKRDSEKVKAYIQTFDGPQGRAVIQDLMQEANFLGKPRLDHASLAFDAGAQHIVKRILKLTNMSLEELEVRMREYDKTT